MANKKDEFNSFETLSHQDTDVNYETTSTVMPPPYADEPPSYASIVDNNNILYASAPPSVDYMDKLPFEDSNPRNYPQPPPAQAHPNFTLHVNQQVTTQQLSLNPHSSHVHPNPLHTMPTAPHKVLLQPAPSRVVETVSVGRRKTVSHVTDLESGKEYFIKERKSRSGLRSKAIIKEVGGPKTCVKETPKRTVVCQKR